MNDKPTPAVETLPDPDKLIYDPDELVIVDNGAMTFTPPDKWYLVTVHDPDNNLIGAIEIDRKTHQLKFEGDLDETAKQFAKLCNAHLQSLRDGRDGL